MMNTLIVATSFIGESIRDLFVEDRSGPQSRRVVTMFDVWLSRGNICINSTSSIIFILDLPTVVREKLQEKSGAIPDRQKSGVLLQLAACRLHVILMQVVRRHPLILKRQSSVRPMHLDCRYWPTLPT